MARLGHHRCAQDQAYRDTVERDNHLDLINFLDPGPEEAGSQPTEEANTPEVSEESNILDPSGEELRFKILIKN